MLEAIKEAEERTRAVRVESGLEQEGGSTTGAEA
jgi:hypothetical protein